MIAIFLMKANQELERAVEVLDPRSIIDLKRMDISEAIPIQMDGPVEPVVQLLSHAGLTDAEGTVDNDDHRI
jgi:hypothetical protein